MELPAYVAIVMHYCLVVVITFGVLLAVYGLFVAVRLYLNRKYLKNCELIWLELTPPATLEKTPESTTQLFSVIHGLRTARSFKDHVLNRAPVLDFEIVSSKQEGIRYLVCIERSWSDVLQKAVAAYIPDAKVRPTEYTPSPTQALIEFKQQQHYVLPLTTPRNFEQHDPLSYVTAAMTKLSDDEQLTMQLVITPVKLSEATRLSKRIRSNEDILQKVSHGGISRISKVSGMVGSGLLNMTDAIGETYHGSTSAYKHNASSRDAAFQTQVQKRQRPARTLSAFELELMESMNQKVSQQLFQVSLRIMTNGQQAHRQLAALRSALDGYSMPPYQALKAKLRLPLFDEYHKRLANKRLPNLSRKRSLILSATEVASLYHFPSTRISKTDNLVTSLSRTLPAPISLKNNPQLDVILGENTHRDVHTPIGLTAAERERHIYIIGGTGNGKTTMLQYGIVQDMQNGKGLAVVDPHGDMAETLLRHVPEHRIKDVVYFNPDDIERPIGMNLLEIPDGLNEDQKNKEKDLVTESLVSVFRKIFSEEDTGGHRIEYVLRSTIQTALTVKDATIFTIFELLNDPVYRTKVVAKLDNKHLINFWKHELGKAGDMQKVKMAAGITAKIGRFLFSDSAKRVLEQPKSTINFEEIIDEGKILICNFSKGLIGEDTSELFGITVLAKLQLASLRRARVRQGTRKPFYLYVDEFQNFATQSFVQMLSESRKYKLFLTMAEQSTSQQKDQRMVQIVLANVGTILCFRTGNPADEKLLLPLFSPYINEGEISNQPPFNFYARFASTISQEPLSGNTIVLESDGDETIAEKVRKASRATYGNDPLPQEKPRKTASSGDKAKSNNQRKKTAQGDPEDTRN